MGPPVEFPMVVTLVSLSSVNGLVFFVGDVAFLFCEVGTEFLNIFWMNNVLQSLKTR
jgi:hypothetical protein